ncbi:tbc1 domain family member 20 [Lichtheimia corymbifera JMRC:FSU:9682]|uniref:Tbc1 domain family member 20 n=1 Tax=Lichtheimia corymbifera JMRC:FSU:9682 TaxID=1263082 RepID=A0A068RZ34_9FUNG|nr:tbc1 domain family member 20 [Lichtheimia corymbifera JMRC:FSU:9682]
MTRRRTKSATKRHRKGASATSKKIAEINDALKENDIAALRHLGRTMGGFLNDSIRRKAWRALLGYENRQQSIHDKHKDESQVALDVARSFNTFPKDIRPKTKNQLRSKLQSVILHVLRAYPKLHYYQGFHDIASVFALVFNEKDAGILMENVALFFVRDAMLESLDPILRQLTLMDTLIQKEDPELHEHITGAGVLPYYCLSWVITWFSHDLDDVNKILRLFDLFLCSNPLMPLYLSAALVLSRRKQVLMEECDPSMIHTTLSKVPQDIPIEHLIQWAIKLETAYPPKSLQRESGIGLDQVSAINTYEDLWLMEASREQACNIIAMSPEERLPMDTSGMHDSSAQKILGRLRAIYHRDTAMWSVLLLSTGVVALAIITSNTDAIREWWMTLGSAGHFPLL